jgi:CO/xanthine dehydrogenase Mo-binding subunit
MDDYSYLSEEVEMASDRTTAALVGRPIPQPDSAEKAFGTTRFSDDIAMPGMLWGVALRSPHANARIRRLDVSEARGLAGVHAVLTAADVPGVNLRGNFPGDRDDRPVLVADRARAVGDAIVLVAAESPEIADEALSRIRIDYELGTPVEDPLVSLRPDTPLIDERGNVTAHMGYVRGDLEEGFAKASVVVDETFRTQLVEHAYLETEAGVAWVDTGGVIHIRCGTQFIENYRFIARILGVPHNKIRVECPLLGGGFGGKITITIEHFLALLAQATGRPVRMALTREESMLSSTKRHPYVLRYRIGADAEGRLTALSAELIGDAGAYTDLSGVMCHYSLSLLAGPYRCANVKADSRMVLTHNPVTTAMRGVGCPQITFALESALDMLAQKLGMDPFELRKRNYLSKGEKLPTAQPLRNAVLLAETWKKAGEALDAALARPGRKVAGSLRRGRGQTSNMTGYGRRTGTISHASIAMQMDGSAVLCFGAPDLGSGQRAGSHQVAATVLGLPMDRVTVQNSDSQTTPLVGMTAGSRQFMNSGNAVLRAAEPIVAALKEAAAGLLSARAEEIVLADGKAFVKGSPEPSIPHARLVAAAAAVGGTLTNLGTFRIEEKPYPGAESCHNAGWMDYTFGSMAAEVAVDAETGEVRILGLGLSHDVGTAVNPQIVTGQCEGGAVQGMGMTLSEDCRPRRGEVEAHDFSKYLIPTSMDIPPLEISLLESGEGEGPFGARGIGEPPCNTTPAAIACAVSAAIGVRVTSLPITPEKVLAALRTGKWPR